MKDFVKFRIGTVVKPCGSMMELGHVVGFSKKWEQIDPKSMTMHMKFYVVVHWATDQIYGDDVVEYDIAHEDPKDLEVLE
jgi:hypothetical protein